MSIDVRPVSRAGSAAFEALFSAEGRPGFCWCTPYRFEYAQEMERDEKRRAMLDLIDDGTPVGVLAFDGDEPVGWCSVAPRRTYAKLDTSRTMPSVDEDAWTIMCLFVKRGHRGEGLTHRLVEGAVEYAGESGAEVIEAYPWDPAGLSGTGPAAHWGRSGVYADAGFDQEGSTRRWVRHEDV